MMGTGGYTANQLQSKNTVRFPKRTGMFSQYSSLPRRGCAKLKNVISFLNNSKFATLAVR